MLTLALSLPGKAKDWVKNHPVVAGGGAAATLLLAGLAISAYPVWKKLVQPRLENMRRAKTSGRVVKRDLDDDLLQALSEDPEVFEFLEQFAAAELE